MWLHKVLKDMQEAKSNDLKVILDEIEFTTDSTKTTIEQKYT